MFYICDKKEQSQDVLYGVMDTSDGVVEYYSSSDLGYFVESLGISIKGVSIRTQMIMGRPARYVDINVKSESDKSQDFNWESLIDDNYRITEDCDLVRNMKIFGDKVGMHLNYSDDIDVEESCFNDSMFGLTVREILDSNVYSIDYHIVNSELQKYRLSVCYDLSKKGFYLETQHSGYDVFGVNVLEVSNRILKFKDLVGLFFSIK